MDGIKLARTEKNSFAEMLFSYYSLAAIYKIGLESDNLYIHGELIESIFALSNKTVWVQWGWQERRVQEFREKFQ